ncbi:MAG: hypothetical protein B7X99_17540 [Rhizobiales bacterium 17-65-6]|nr:MAG: hypothetical protein B7Y95_11955 [Rhizobiales bacterium 32-66-11]OYY88592.1 MAG: hypothetical protein B7Y61_01880 [Rhizobiales bacterium 35-66-30]OYZ90282.1 MAG: hypothetical protein B7X99_17540 [Rhizobiales bacterium 17-65-6]OZB07354.1 MAG: hypothetical protein B7X67_08845 [Rhizobiales bacterium 39-66-18]
MGALGGQVTVNAGARLGGSGTIGGYTTVSGTLAAILNNGTLAADFTDSASVSATLSGTGAFIKSGVGALNYTGNGSAFSGATTVVAGLLSVNGSLGGAVDVLSGGTLGGSGTVGAVTVASGAALAPGNSIGTLNVAGDVTFAAGSVYEVEVGGPGAADLIAAGGQAILQGGTVEVATLDASTSYVTGQSYTILTAQGGITGSFDEAVSEAPFLSVDLGGAGNSLTITIAVSNSFTDAAITPNQYATASALDTLPQAGPMLGLYNALLFLPSASEARAAFDQLSGDTHASVQGLFVENSFYTRQAVTNRLRAAFGGVGASSAPVISYVPAGGGNALAYAAPATGAADTEAGMALKAVAAPATTQGLALWATGYGAWTDIDGNANAAGLSSDAGGFLIGADAPIGAGWRLGVVGGYGYTSFDFGGGRNASGSSDDWTIGAYAGNQWGAFGLRTGLAYSRQDVESSRSVAFEGFADQLSADYDAGTFQAFGELGYKIETGFVSFEPFAGLAYVSLDTDSFTERGGADDQRQHDGHHLHHAGRPAGEGGADRLDGGDAARDGGLAACVRRRHAGADAGLPRLDAVHRDRRAEVSNHIHDGGTARRTGTNIATTMGICVGFSKTTSA